MAQIIQVNLIKDDNDQYWVYSGRKIRCVGDDSPDGGYYCEDFFHGINKLIGFGYINGDEVLQTSPKNLTPNKPELATASEAVGDITKNVMGRQRVHT